MSSNGQNSFVIRYERSDGSWKATAKRRRSCRADAPTLEEAERRIREQLGHRIDDPSTLRLERDVALPPIAKSSLREALKFRKRTAQAEMKEQQVLRSAIVQLRQEVGLEAADAALLLGIPEEQVRKLEESNAPPL